MLGMSKGASMKTWCYWKLHKECVSYKLGSSGRVSHTAEIWLTDVKFHVLERGRQKVLREKRKNVHSFVIGQVLTTLPNSVRTDWSLLGFRKAYYNPYKTDKWIDAETGEVLLRASRAIISNKTVWYKEAA